MTAPERRQADLLDHYRRRLARDPAAAAPPDLDPAIAAVARALARQRAPAPDAAFTAALRQRLFDHQRQETTMARQPAP